MSVAPISPVAAALRVQIVGAAETELMSALTAMQEAEATLPAAPGASPAAARAATAATDAPATPTGPESTAPAPPDPVRQAVDTARASAAGRQESLAPLLADLAQALARPGLPPAVRAAIGQVLAMQLSASGPFTAETVRQAVAQSGLFLEAHLAQAPPAAAGAPPDLKAALLTLLRVLPEPPATDPTTAAPPPPAQKTPPPVRGAALTAQPPATATLPAEADLPAIAQHLRPQVEQAVARQTLHQLASLPDGQAAAWMFELPMATPQGAAVAQFEVHRDAPETTGADPAAATWRVRFSLDMEPLGPLQVHLGLSGDRTAVTVWAEREASVELLRSQGAELAQALPGEVVFRLGAPREAVPERGQFVDQSS